MSEESEKDWKKFREETALEDVEQEEMDEKALDHPSYQALEEKLTRSEQQAHENWEKSVRALAELENVRRRAERDVENAHRYSLEKIVNSLLPVVDSLEQAISLLQSGDEKNTMEGLELTMKLFIDALMKHGVEQIDPVGEVFNPMLHEAMSMQANQEAKPNTVLVVFQKGYTLNGRMIRPARVIVAQ